MNIYIAVQCLAAIVHGYPAILRLGAEEKERATEHVRGEEHLDE